MNNISDSRVRLLETVTFNENNYVDSFDRSAFSKTIQLEKMINGLPCVLKLSQSTDPSLEGLSIFKIKMPNQRMKMLVKHADVSSLFANKAFTMQDLGIILQKSNATTQEEGSQVRELIDAMRDAPLAFASEKKRIKDKVLQVKAAQKADQMTKTFLLRNLDIDEEMVKAGLKEHEINLIKGHSSGTHNIVKFMQTYQLPPNSTVTVIGLNHKNIIHGVVKTLDCEDYMDAYHRIYGDFRARDDFMENLTKENHPVLFLVPQNLFGPKQGVTAGEMKWLLNHPKDMSQVHFVFGAYRSFSSQVLPKNMEELKLETYTDFLTERLFKQVQAHLKLEKMEYDPKPDFKALAVRVGQFKHLTWRAEKAIPFRKIPKEKVIDIFAEGQNREDAKISVEKVGRAFVQRAKEPSTALIQRDPRKFAMIPYVKPYVKPVAFSHVRKAYTAIPAYDREAIEVD